jgi:hypothetical protein
MGAMWEWQTDAAAKLGVSQAEFKDMATTTQEAALATLVQETAEGIGITPGQLASTVALFCDRTQADADTAGISHEQYLGAMLEVRPAALPAACGRLCPCCPL